MLRGVIFDIDGTLVASNEAHARSWVQTLSEAGYEVPFDVIWPMIGMGGDKVLPSAAGIEVDSAKGKALAERRWKIFKSDYLHRLEPTPGARSLVARMKADGLKTIVATSASGNELGPLLDVAGVADLMDVTASSSDAAESKPDPDIVMAAVRKSRLKPEELSGAVAIYDNPGDLLRWYDESPFAIEALAE